jgi:hypothetical protein
MIQISEAYLVHFLKFASKPNVEDKATVIERSMANTFNGEDPHSS